MSEHTSYAAGTPSWVDLITPDPEAARTFYGGLFGWEFDVSTNPQAGGYTMALVRGKRVAGLGQPPDPSMPSVWTTYLATDDAAKTVEQITEHGGTVMMPPMQVMDAGTMAVAADPTGAVFGLWQAGTQTGAQLANEPGTVGWNELNTRDLDAATAFYTAALGVRFEPMDTGEGGPRYLTMHVGEPPVGGAQQMPAGVPAEMPAHWMTYFDVEDSDAAVAKATELGGSVRMSPMDSPYGRFAVLSDPQGAVFTVISGARQP